MMKSLNLMYLVFYGVKYLLCYKIRDKCMLGIPIDEKDRQGLRKAVVWIRIAVVRLTKGGAYKGIGEADKGSGHAG